MYDYIKGILTKITAKTIVVETHGIGYALQVANPYRFSDKVGTDVQFYLHQVVREDAHLLFGFATEEEKNVFLNLISVTGIGPTTALAIIAVDDNDGLVAAIDSSNITYLTKFPKVGKKTAQQMVLDLAGKFEPSATSADEGGRADKPVSQGNPALDEAIEALLALGYKATELKKIKTFFEGTTDTTENYIKSALKMLMK
ncbi:Holliday junction DNA helicase RuvA [Streptococcus rupicaprae]|uniref:Holliday junction branch migration complex subunit RuvA n=1 Tax=Streptococcus rupicaprae TaxID=759619 RepID=A0ABV2FJ70_9STRE